MAKRTKWIKARGKLPQLEACIRVREELPSYLWFDPTRLSRFENGGSANIDVVALAALSMVYGKSLRDIDPAAADAYEALLVTVGRLRSASDLGSQENVWVTPADEQWYTAAEAEAA